MALAVIEVVEWVHLSHYFQKSCEPVTQLVDRVHHWSPERFLTNLVTCAARAVAADKVFCKLALRFLSVVLISTLCFFSSQLTRSVWPMAEEAPDGGAATASSGAAQSPTAPSEPASHLFEFPVLRLPPWETPVHGTLIFLSSPSCASRVAVLRHELFLAVSSS